MFHDKVPRLTGKKVVSALKKAGFIGVRETGSHHHLHYVCVMSLFYMTLACYAPSVRALARTPFPFVQVLQVNVRIERF